MSSGSFFFFFPQGCCVVDLHWVSDAHKSPDHFRQHCRIPGSSPCCERQPAALGQKSPIPPNPKKGSFAASMLLHTPWSVNYCFYLSPFTVCILSLLSLPISLNSADSSILLGGSSSSSLSSPAFTVLILRKMLEQKEKRYMNFKTNRISLPSYLWSSE